VIILIEIIASHLLIVENINYDIVSVDIGPAVISYITILLITLLIARTSILL